MSFRERRRPPRKAPGRQPRPRQFTASAAAGVGAPPAGLSVAVRWRASAGRAGLWRVAAAFPAWSLRAACPAYGRRRREPAVWVSPTTGRGLLACPAGIRRRLSRAAGRWRERRTSPRGYGIGAPAIAARSLVGRHVVRPSTRKHKARAGRASSAMRRPQLVSRRIPRMSGGKFPLRFRRLGGAAQKRSASIHASVSDRANCRWRRRYTRLTSGLSRSLTAPVGNGSSATLSRLAAASHSGAQGR